MRKRCQHGMGNENDSRNDKNVVMLFGRGGSVAGRDVASSSRLDFARCHNKHGRGHPSNLALRHVP